MNTEKKNSGKGGCCDVCEADFERNIENIVDEVKGYTGKDHDRKRREVEAAFGGSDRKEK